VQEPVVAQGLSVLEISIEKATRRQIWHRSAVAAAALLDHACDIQVTALIAIASPKHCYRAGVPDARDPASVKTIDNEHVAVADADQLKFGTVMQASRARLSATFPRHDIPGV
jgi:hypothetical protein